MPATPIDTPAPLSPAQQLAHVEAARRGLQAYAIEIGDVRAREMPPLLTPEAVLDKGYYRIPALDGYRQLVTIFQALQSGLTPHQTARLDQVSAILDGLKQDEITLGLNPSSQQIAAYTETKLNQLKTGGETYLISGHDSHFGVVRIHRTPNGYTYTVFDSGHEARVVGSRGDSSIVNALEERAIRPGADIRNLIENTVAKEFVHAESDSYRTLVERINSAIDPNILRARQALAQVEGNCSTQSQRFLIEEVLGDEPLATRLREFVTDPHTSMAEIDDQLAHREAALQGRPAMPVAQAPAMLEHLGWKRVHDATLGDVYRFDRTFPVNEAMLQQPVESKFLNKTMQRNGVTIHWAVQGNTAFAYIPASDQASLKNLQLHLQSSPMDLQLGLSAASTVPSDFQFRWAQHRIGDMGMVWHLDRSFAVHGTREDAIEQSQFAAEMQRHGIRVQWYKGIAYIDPADAASLANLKQYTGLKGPGSSTYATNPDGEDLVSAHGGARNSVGASAYHPALDTKPAVLLRSGPPPVDATLTVPAADLQRATAAIEHAARSRGSSVEIEAYAVENYGKPFYALRSATPGYTFGSAERTALKTAGGISFFERHTLAPPAIVSGDIFDMPKPARDYVVFDADKAEKAAAALRGMPSSARTIQLHTIPAVDETGAMISGKKGAMIAFQPDADPDIAKGQLAALDRAGVIHIRHISDRTNFPAIRRALSAAMGRPAPAPVPEIQPPVAFNDNDVLYSDRMQQAALRIEDPATPPKATWETPAATRLPITATGSERNSIAARPEYKFDDFRPHKDLVLREDIAPWKLKFPTRTISVTRPTIGEGPLGGLVASMAITALATSVITGKSLKDAAGDELSGATGYGEFMDGKLVQGSLSLGSTVASTAAPWALGVTSFSGGMLIGAGIAVPIMHAKMLMNAADLSARAQAVPEEAVRLLIEHVPADLRDTPVPSLNNLAELKRLQMQCRHEGKQETVDVSVTQDGNKVEFTGYGNDLPGRGSPLESDAVEYTNTIRDQMHEMARDYLAMMTPQQVQAFLAQAHLAKQAQQLTAMLPGRGADLGNPYLSQMDGLKHTIQSGVGNIAAEQARLEALGQYYLSHGGKLEYAQMGIDQYKRAQPQVKAFEAMLPAGATFSDVKLQTIEFLKEDIHAGRGDVKSEQAVLDALSLAYLKHLDPDMTKALQQAQNAIDQFKVHGELNGARSGPPAGHAAGARGTPTR